MHLSRWKWVEVTSNGRPLSLSCACYSSNKGLQTHGWQPSTHTWVYPLLSCLLLAVGECLAHKDIPSNGQVTKLDSWFLTVLQFFGCDMYCGTLQNCQSSVLSCFYAVVDVIAGMCPLEKRDPSWKKIDEPLALSGSPKDLYTNVWHSEWWW